MWFFHRRKKPQPHKIIRRVVSGLIIGGAIGSVIGKHLVEKHGGEIEDDKEDDVSGD